jgi:hypothetical protein
MHAAQHERRAEPAVARRRHVKRHVGNRQRLEAAPQPFEFGMTDAGAGAPGAD